MGFAVACSSDGVTPELAPPIDTPSLLAAATETLKCPLSSGTDYLLRCWGPSQRITIGTTTNIPAYRTLLYAGVQKWSNRLADGLLMGTPQLIWDDSQTPPEGGWTITINVVGNPQGTSICGSEGGGVITLTSCVNAATFGTLDVVLAHELSSAMGWEDESVEQLLHKEAIYTPEAIGVSDRCVSVFPAGDFPVALNTEVCNHDVDGVMRLYDPDNYPTVNLGTFAQYWGVPILSQTDVEVSTSSVAIGDSIAISASLLYATEPEAGYFVSAPTSPNAHQYVPNAPVRLERRGNFLAPVESATEGAATFALRPFAPAGFRLLRPLERFGKQFSVEVTAPPPNLPPSGFAAVTLGTTSIGLTWDPPSAVPAEYVLERATGSSGPFTEIGRPDGNDTGFNDAGLSAATTYWYRVAAVRGGAQSDYSSVSSATTDAAPLEPLRIIDLIVPDTALHIGSMVIFQGVVAGVQPNEPITFYWDFDESDTPGPDGSYQQIPDTFHRWVREGDYTLTVTVRPYSDWRGFGLPQIREVVVCPSPGGGGDLFVMSTSKKPTPGNPVPMAPSGCAQ